MAQVRRRKKTSPASPVAPPEKVYEPVVEPVLEEPVVEQDDVDTTDDLDYDAVEE